MGRSSDDLWPSLVETNFSENPDFLSENGKLSSKRFVLVENDNLRLFKKRHKKVEAFENRLKSLILCGKV